MKQSSKYTLDRFEGDIAVLLLRDNEEFELHVPTVQLPTVTKKGDILEIQFDDKGNIVVVQYLNVETEAAKRKATSLLNKLLERKSD